MGCPWEMMTDQTGIQTSNAPWISNQVLYPLSYLAPLWWSDKLEYRHQTAQLEEHLTRHIWGALDQIPVWSIIFYPIQLQY